MTQPIPTERICAGHFPLRPAARIKLEVAGKHGVTVSAIESRRRSKKLVPARQECMYRIRVELGYSMPHIGKLMGGMDNTTVLYGIGCHAILNDLPFPSPGAERVVMKRPGKWVLKLLDERRMQAAPDDAGRAA